MGAKQPSVRTLATGEKVTHYPDGREVLVPSNSLGDILGGLAPEQEAASVTKTDALVQAALDKREAQVAGDPVPSDKRVV